MRTLVTGGTVISMDAAVGDLARGDVLITDGVITEVAERIDAPDAEVIDAAGRVVLPGFVDTHRHTWQTAMRGVGADWTFPEYMAAMHGEIRPHYRPEDVYLGNLLGRLEALHSGITTVLDWFHCADSPGHADAAIAGLKDAPGRSIFCYAAGFMVTDGSVENEIRRVRDELSSDGLVTMAFGLRGHQMTTMDTCVADLKLADELGLRSSVHFVSDGTSRPVAEMHAAGLLRDTLTVVHANGISDDELRMLADAGASVSVSPDVELKMGFGWPMTGRMLAAGLRPTFSIDDCPSAGGDMFATMRTAFVVQRGLDGGLNSRDLLEFATIDGAKACGLNAGSLAPGKVADIVLLRKDDPSVFPFNNPAGTIVAAGHPGLVDTVLVGGRVVKRDGALVGVDLPALQARLLESRDRIAAGAGITV
ncbi:amidohydrolase family protein [Lentzea kentuckyensis]|uniref:amidohydrolase family protein n=1 Tax=Lentzea kentuckyensis TaxID=360086 RepID=UPI000A3662F0|nr:amidohydrolase family protein [Lentzea kentuckyensis]